MRANVSRGTRLSISGQIAAGSPEFTGGHSRRLPESEAESGWGRETQRVCNGLDGLIAGQQALGMVDPAARNIITDRAAPAGTKAAAELAYRETAKTG